MKYTIIYNRCFQVFYTVLGFVLLFMSWMKTPSVGSSRSFFLMVFGIFLLGWALALNKVIEAYQQKRYWAWVTNLVITSTHAFSIFFPVAIINLAKNLKENYRNQFLSASNSNLCPVCRAEIVEKTSSSYCKECLSDLNERTDPLLKAFWVRFGSSILILVFGFIYQVSGSMDLRALKEKFVAEAEYKPSNFKHLSLEQLHEKKHNCSLTNNTKCVTDCFFELSQRNPNDDFFLANYAFRLTSLGYHRQAVEAYRKMDSDMTYDSAAFFAQSLEALGQLGEAIHWYRYSLKISDRSLDVTYNLAKLLIKEHDYVGAKKLVNDFIGKYPKAKDYFKPLMGLMGDELQKDLKATSLKI